ncbi:hypothetical protein [Hellea balneolensis]|uniref:hypothetical protein n=1 Tax=Hellea balneolensis TaxID=287478 RepID=UPI0004060A6B|nr:hypothetical protein [Hellea balneolensis]
MTRTAKHVGKPVAVKRDDNGTLTHLYFENRTRATTLKNAIQFVEPNLAEKLKVSLGKNGQKILIPIEGLYFDDLPEE